MYKYTHFITENIAPVGAKKIGVYDSTGRKIYSFPLGNLSSSLNKEDVLYSFCALADIHVQEDKYPTSTEDFQRALAYAEANCDFTCIAGDLVDNAAYESQLANYKTIVDAYSPTKPVYAITGNHENYSGACQNYWEKYSGQPLYYSFTKGNDVFIMVGHYGGYGSSGWQPDEVWAIEELQWLYETLEANRNKRCFVFTHVLPYGHGVGNPNNLYGKRSSVSRLWNVNDGGIGQLFISLLRHYKNTILFHGHSHTKLQLQEIDDKANYSNIDGYRNVHIPSLAIPRDVAEDETNLTEVFAESEGYIIDIYDNCVVLNGRDFIDNEKDGHLLPIATYKIDTTIQPVEANTFTDTTGIITTL